jgi:hypothetical protein
MSEFFGTYGFFILVALLMFACHLGHGGHGGHGRQGGRRDGDADDTPPGRGHQH